MGMTAFEQNRHLHIDLGDGTVFRVPPVPGAVGITMLANLVKVSFGTDLPNAETDAQGLARAALGESEEGWEEREALYESLRASEQTRVAQAAILWNVQGGSIDAVHDLLNTEAGEAYPKALGRVMRSCGLGMPFAQLTTWLNGASASPGQTGSSAPTSGPTGTSNTSASEPRTATPPTA